MAESPATTQAGEGWGVNLPSQAQQGGYQPDKECNGHLAGNEPLLQGDKERASLQPFRNTIAPLGLTLFLLYHRKLTYAVIFLKSGDL